MLKYDPDAPSKKGEASGTEEAAPAVEDPFKDVPVLSRTSAELYLFDTETDMFVIQEKDVQVDVAENGSFESELLEAIVAGNADFSLGHRSK